MIKIALIGPESSGKTTLCKTLAQHFNGYWTSEYARDYLTNTSGIYDISDLDIMAQDQFDLWEQVPNHEICFYDTEMINYKVWSINKYNICSKLILSLVDSQQFDLYLLCMPDLPYEIDSLREFPSYEKRYCLFEKYEEELRKYNFNYKIVNGSNISRSEKAISIIQSIF
jgi:NadR type nicotinamide-nucleotide adenylyltransferase